MVMPVESPPLDNSALNRMLCESKVPIAVRETMALDAKSIRKLSVQEASAVKSRLKITEAAGATVDDIYEAKVGHADKINQNRRIYPREVWQDNINRHMECIEGGYLVGLDSHYKDAPSDISTKWVDLRMEDDGAVMAHFQVIPTEIAGKSLQTCLDKKVGAVGFSTLGYGTGHEPGESERAKYGLGADDYATIMDPNYELERIDSVLGPSVNDARVTGYPDNKQGQPKSERAADKGNKRRFATADDADAYLAKTHGGHGRIEDTTGKCLSQCRCGGGETVVALNANWAAKPEKHTCAVQPHREAKSTENPNGKNAMDPINSLSELATKAPTVHAEHVRAVEAAKTAAASAATSELAVVKEANKKLVAAVNPLLEGLKAIPEVALPQREVAPAEFAESKRVLEAKVATLESDKATLTAKVATLESEKTALADKITARENAEKIVAKARPIIKDNSYRTLLLKAIDTKAKSDPTFTDAQVEAFITEKCAEYDEIKGATGGGKKEEAKPAPKQPGNEMNGSIFGDDDLDRLENAEAAASKGGGQRDGFAESFSARFGGK